VNRLGIVGTGLIGASIGLRARRNGLPVYGYDSSIAASKRALELGAIDEVVARSAVFEECDTIVLAMPISATCRELERIRGLDPQWQVILDVASVKRPIQTAAAGVAKFVATHPLAGSEMSGPAGASAAMFDERSWIVISSGDVDCDERAQRFVTSLGARPLAMTAHEHDAALALTSHLPQLLAFLLAPRILGGAGNAERLCGPAGLETLRLGRSDRALWTEIFAANADNLAAGSRELAAALVDACDALKSGSFSER
jgi:prephenate dehydrogenase